MRGSSAGTLWSRSDLHARAMALVVLGVLTGLTIGLATAAYDGARRTDTALARLQTGTNASDAVVFATQTNLVQADWSKLAKRPEIKSLVRWGLVFGNVAGSEGDVLFVPMDDVWLNTVDRPIVVAGRMFDTHASDEVVISTDVVAETGGQLGVGKTIPFTAMTSDGDFTTPASGPKLDLRIVGIVKTPLSYVFSGGAYLSPGYLDKFGKDVLIAENSVVQLQHGAADVAALRRDASADLAAGVPVLDFHVTGRRVTATTDVEGAMLRLLAAIVLLAGVAFVDQALARSATTIGADATTLRALGMTRGELVAAAIRPHLVTVCVGVAVTVLTAVVASRWFPVGLAASVDPSRGIQINVALFALAAVIAAATTLAVVGFSSWRAARPEAVNISRRSTWLALPVTRPVPLRLGVRMAMEGSGSARRKGSAWPALIGATAAVAGVVGIVTVDHGLADAVAHPEVAGVAWDASVVPAQSDISLAGGVQASLVDSVARQRGVAAVSSIGRSVSQIGELGVPVFAVVDPAAGDAVHLVTLSGRPPAADGEIVLGPSTAHDLGARIGDKVILADGRSATVVGLGLFPSDVHAQFDQGALVSVNRWRQLASQSQGPKMTIEMIVAVRFADRSHIDTQIDNLGEALGPTVEDVTPVDQPPELANLHHVRTLPNVLAIFLAAFGAVAIGHALFSSVYRRRRDFAVLQSLGVTRRGVRIMIAAQATAVGLAGLVMGVPIGLITGRAGWQAITDRVPLTFHSPLTLFALLLVVPVALIVANLLAILPARRASRAHPALVLRSE